MSSKHLAHGQDFTININVAPVTATKVEYVVDLQNGGPIHATVKGFLMCDSGLDGPSLKLDVMVAKGSTTFEYVGKTWRVMLDKEWMGTVHCPSDQWTLFHDDTMPKDEIVIVDGKCNGERKRYRLVPVEENHAD